MMKKFGIKALLVAFFICILTGCGVETSSEVSNDRLKIVCTIFPQYDWTKEILGELAEDAELTLLLKNGADLHSYQPTVWDMVKISEADLFFYVGGTSDFWVEDALANVKNPDQKAVDLLEIVEEYLLEEEHHHEHAHDADTCELHDHSEEAEYDEHIWLSLKNTMAACEAMAETLCAADEENRTVYEKNAANYLAKLAALDRAYHEAVDEAETPVLLFGDRFPFRYLTDDYGLTYYAAFEGCSAETEASFETITSLANTVDELRLPVVLAIDGSDQKIAKTIAGNTSTRDQKVLVLDSMQSVSSEEIENGTSYFAIMEKNLGVLREALGVSRR